MKRYSKKGIILLCCLVYFVSYFARKNFAAVSVSIIESGILTKSTAGLIGTAMFAMYGIGQVISGISGDKFSPRLLISCGLVTTALCNAAMPLVNNGVLMIFIWGLNGLAQAMLWPPIVRILAKHLDHEAYVKANLLVTSAAHVATVILYLYAPVCLILFSWKSVFVSAGIIALVAFLIFIIGISAILPKDSEIAEKSQDKHLKKTDSIAPVTENFAKILTKAGILPIFLAIVAMGFLRDGIESWLPTLYSEAFHRDPAESIVISVLLPLFSIAFVSAATVLHKKLFNNETLGAAILFISAALLCIPLYLLMDSTATFIRIVCLVLAALVCGCMHSANFLYISCLPGRFAKIGHAAGTSGLCNAFTYVGASVSTYGIALIAESLSWRANAFVWACVAVVGFICALLSYRPYTKFISQG